MRTYERLLDALHGVWFALWNDSGVPLLAVLLMLLCVAVGPRVVPWACACMGVELMNTAIECLSDFACRGRHDDRIGAVKDMAAAASLMCQCAVLHRAFT